jgi:hypothetical protein
MEDKPIIEFFYNSTLKGSKFYFYCPNMKEKEKTLITNLIYDYEGKISSRFTKNTIIIVETEEVIKSPNFLKMIDNYGDIYFNNNNHIEIIKHNSKKNKIIKIITFKELLLELAAFDNKSINYFIERGLNQNINQEAMISLIFNTNKNKTQLESYDFSYQDDKKNVYFDIPYFHHNVPEGFSVFCTDEEYELVINHVNKKGYKLRQKNKNKNKEEMITSEPEPTKKNYICQLCRVQFNNYKEHINSGEHNKNINENKNAFNKLSLTFKRIVDNNFNKIKENKGKKIVLNSSHLDFQFLSEKIKTKEKSNYNLRNKIINNKYNENNYTNYVRKNNSKILDISSPQQQVSSTASCTFKNALTCLDEISDTNKNKEITKKIKKRKRNKDDDEDFNFEDDIYFKNKRIKV